MDCLLCLESVHDLTKCIEVDSMQWQELSIKTLLDKYLWCIEPITSDDCVCSSCWEALSDFHKFYTRIEEAHNANKLLVTEADPLEQEDDCKYTEMLQETVLDSETTIGQTFDISMVIKQESELPDAVLIGDNISNEDYTGAIDYSSDNSEYSKDADSDYNLPLTHRQGKYSAKSNGADDNSQTEIKSFSKSSSERQTSGRKSYHTSRINRVEYDKFLQEHFKFTCNKCQETFERFRLLCQHYRKEHNEQGFAICCDIKFFNRRLLVDHINYHLNPDYFKCTLCGKVFTKRMCLLAHKKMHDDKKYCCDVCDKKFSQKNKLQKHKLTHLPESDKKFPCNECGKFYATEYILTRHQRCVHLNVYARICEICGQTMPDAYTFKRHMEKHNGIPPSNLAKCDICGLTVTCQASLKIHKEVKHPVDGKRDYNCHICTKISPNMRALKKHIRESHEIGYQYKCTVCSKEFKRSDNFKAHMATHTGTPLCRCPWCPKEFNSNGSMHQHRKKSHPIEWEEAQRKKYSGNLPPNFKKHSKFNS